MHNSKKCTTFAVDFKKGPGLNMNTKIKTEERIERLVMVIGTESLPRKAIIAGLGLRQNARRNFRDNYMKPATSRGLVKMQFPEIPSLPEQRYKLTEKGLEFWEELKSKKHQANQKRTRLVVKRLVKEIRNEKRTMLIKKGPGYLRDNSEKDQAI